MMKLSQLPAIQNDVPVVVINPFHKKQWIPSKSIPGPVENVEYSERYDIPLTLPVILASAPNEFLVQNIIGKEEIKLPRSKTQAHPKLSPRAVHTQKQKKIQIKGNFISKNEREKSTLQTICTPRAPSPQNMYVADNNCGNDSTTDMFKLKGKKLHHATSLYPPPSIKSNNTTIRSGPIPACTKLDHKDKLDPKMIEEESSFVYLDSTIYDSMDRSLTLPSINFTPANLRRRGRKHLHNRVTSSRASSVCKNLSSCHRLGVANALDVFSHVGKPSFVERDICLQLKNTIRYLRRTKDSNNGESISHESCMIPTIGEASLSASWRMNQALPVTTHAKIQNQITKTSVSPRYNPSRLRTRRPKNIRLSQGRPEVIGEDDINTARIQPETPVSANAPAPAPANDVIDEAEVRGPGVPGYDSSAPMTHTDKHLATETIPPVPAVDDDAGKVNQDEPSHQSLESDQSKAGDEEGVKVVGGGALPPISGETGNSAEPVSIEGKEDLMGAEAAAAEMGVDLTVVPGGETIIVEGGDDGCGLDVDGATAVETAQSVEETPSVTIGGGGGAVVVSPEAVDGGQSGASGSDVVSEQVGASGGGGEGVEKVVESGDEDAGQGGDSGGRVDGGDNVCEVVAEQNGVSLEVGVGGRTNQQEECSADGENPDNGHTLKQDDVNVNGGSGEDVPEEGGGEHKDATEINTESVAGEGGIGDESQVDQEENRPVATGGVDANEGV